MSFFNSLVISVFQIESSLLPDQSMFVYKAMETVADLPTFISSIICLCSISSLKLKNAKFMLKKTSYRCLFWGYGYIMNRVPHHRKLFSAKVHRMIRDKTQRTKPVKHKYLQH